MGRFFLALILAAAPVFAEAAPAVRAPDLSHETGRFKELLEDVKVRSRALSLAAPQADLARADIPNFAHSGGGYYRGGQPSEEGFRLLKKLGLKTILNLRQDPQSYERPLVESLGMRYVAIPMSAWKPPADASIDAFLTLIQDEKTGPIFVHCQRGADRTGILSAIRRMKLQDWKPKPAAREMVSFKALAPKLIRFVFVYYKRLHPEYVIPDDLSEFIPEQGS